MTKCPLCDQKKDYKIIKITNSEFCNFIEDRICCKRKYPDLSNKVAQKILDWSRSEK